MKIADESPLMVGWKVSTLSPSVASVRYRALLPIIALEAENVTSHLFSDGKLTNLDGLDILLIIKSFTIEDVCLAQEARVRGIPLVFDLCDNIFVDDYGKSTTNWVRDVFLSIAKCASSIVTSTTSLADEIHHQMRNSIPVYIVPDGIETQSLVEIGLRKLKAAQLIASRSEKGRCVDACDKLIKKLKSLRGASMKGVLSRLAGLCWRKLSFHTTKIKFSCYPYFFYSLSEPSSNSRPVRYTRCPWHPE